MWRINLKKIIQSEGAINKKVLANVWRWKGAFVKKEVSVIKKELSLERMEHNRKSPLSFPSGGVRNL